MGMNYVEQLTASFVDELQKIGEKKTEKTAAFSITERLKRLRERRDPDGLESKEAAARPK